MIQFSCDLEQALLTSLTWEPDCLQIFLAPVEAYYDDDEERIVEQYTACISLQFLKKVQIKGNLSGKIIGFSLFQPGIQSWHTFLPLPLSFSGGGSLELIFKGGGQLGVLAEQVQIGFVEKLGQSQLFSAPSLE